MSTEDFKSVGIKVSVQGAKKFANDLEKIQSAFSLFSKNITETLEELKTLAAISNQIASSFNGIVTAANTSAVALRNASGAAGTAQQSLNIASRSATNVARSSDDMSRSVGFAGRAWREYNESITSSANSIGRAFKTNSDYIANIERLRTTLTAGQQAFLNISKATDFFKARMDNMSATTQRTITYFGALSQKIAAARGESLSFSENALLKIATRSETVGNTVQKLNQRYNENSAALAKNESQQKKSYKEMEGLNNQLNNLSQKLVKNASDTYLLQLRLDVATKELVKLDYAAKQAESDLEGYRGATNATREEERKHEKVVNSSRLAFQKKSVEVLRLREELNFLGLQEQEFRQEVDKADKELRESIGPYNILQAEAKQYAQELALLEQQMLRIKNSAGLLGGGFRTTLAAGFQIVRASASKFISVMGTVGKVLLAPQRAVQKFGQSIADLGGRLKGFGDRMFRFSNAFRFYGQSLLFFVSLPIVGVLKSWADSAIEFEDAFAGVIKTVDSSDFRVLEEGSTNINDLTEDGKQLRQAFIDLSNTIPVSATELARIGEIAGQLGIRGTPNLVSFTEVIARLGVSTNLSTEEAANGLARLISIIEGPDIVNKPEEFRRVVESLGGSLVDLGNKLPTTENQILNFAVRIAATGKVAGLSADQILGIGAAFTAVGVPVERGGTAVQKVFIRMLQAAEENGVKLEALAATAGLSADEFASQWINNAGPAFSEFVDAVNEGVGANGEALRTIAEAAGQTADEFKAAWEENAGAAFASFVEGLGKQGSKAFDTLSILELGDARLIQAFLALANAGGRLTESLKISDSAFQPLISSTGEMNALMLESERRFSTTQSQLQILKNQWENLGIALGSFILPTINEAVKYIRALVEKFGELSPAVQKTVIVLALAAAAIGPVIVGTGILLGGISFLISGIGALVAFIGSFVSVLGLLLIPIGAVGIAFVGLAIAFLAVVRNISKRSDDFGQTVSQKLLKWGKAMILALARGMIAAAAAVVRALIYIGGIIRDWLKAKSPPKLLPDIDDWGTAAMNEYMKGWLDADFSIFNDLADIIEKRIRSLAPEDDTSLIEEIIGKRDVIARIVNQIRTVGRASEELIRTLVSGTGENQGTIVRYIHNLEALERTTRLVQRAQEDLNRITDKYARILNPLNSQLQAIQDRKDDIKDAERLQELKDIIADEESTAADKELAALEIREIQLKKQIKQVERRQDAEVSAAEERLKAAEEEQKQAQAQLDATTALIDAQQKNNDLLREQIDLLKQLAEEANKIAAGGGLDEEGLGLDSLGGGGLDTGETDLQKLIDEALGEGGVGGEFDDLTTSFDESVQEMTSQINTAFNDLVTELSTPLSELEQSFTELGETWEPIFQALYDYLVVKVPEWIDTVSERWDTFRTKVGESVNSVVEWFSGARESITGFVDGISEGLSGDALEGSAIGILIDFAKAVGEVTWEELGKGISEFGDAWDNFKKGFEGVDTSGFKALGTALEPFLEGLGKVLAFLGGTTIAAAFLPITSLVRSLGAAFNWAGEWIGQGVRIIIEGFNRFAQAWADLISGRGNILDFFEGIIDGFFRLGEGVINLVVGAFMFVIGFFEGFVSSVIDFFTGLYERLVGSSIVVDLVEGIIEWFRKLLELPGIVAEWIADVVGKIAAFATDTLLKISQWVTDQIAKFLEWKDDVIEKAKTAKDKIVEYIGNLAKDALLAIVDWVRDMIAKFLELKDDITGKIEDAITFIQDSWDAMVQWFIELHQTLYDAIIQPILDAVDDIIGIDLEQVGRDLIQGLIDGINGLINTVFTTLSRLADNIPQWIKDALGIHSPSRVMFSVGEQIVGGLVAGMDAMSPDVKKSMGSIISSIDSGLASSSFVGAIGGQLNGSVSVTNPGTGARYSPAYMPVRLPSSVSNTTNVTVEVNPTYTGHTTPDLLYMDVVSALAASGL